MKISNVFPITLLSIFTSTALSYGGGAGTSAALFLSRTASVRASALAEAFGAAPDDVGTMQFNPAALSSLSSGQASFQYEKGLADDAFGNLTVGLPAGSGGAGVSINYYNGGELNGFDGAQKRYVTSQRDLAIGFSKSARFRSVSAGASLKYVSSRLADQASAQAVALDLGVHTNLTPSIFAGASLQNMGTSLRYRNESYSLPRIARLSGAKSILTSWSKMQISADAAYWMNEKQWRPAVGLEISPNLLSFRTGYQHGDESKLSLGVGLSLSSLMIDYSVGFFDDIGTRQQIGVTLRFGGSKAGFVALPLPKIENAYTPISVIREEANPALVPSKTSLR